jgi:hypothetical protein
VTIFLTTTTRRPSRAQQNILWLYLVVLVWLSIGVLAKGTPQQILYLIFYALVVIGSFLLFSFWCGNQSLNIKFDYTLDPMLFIMVALTFSAAVFFAQLFCIKHLPVLSAILSNDYNEIVLIRQQIVLDSPTWVNYLVSIMIRAVLPVLCVITLLCKRPFLFALTVILSAFICISLIQKSYIALVYLPVIILSIQKHDWSRLIRLLSVSLISVVFLIFVTNPAIRPNFWNDTVSHLGHRHVKSIHYIVPNRSATILSALAERVFVVPGQVIAEWFTLIPSVIPYGEGCGDRWLAKLKHCDYIQYPVEIYKVLFPLQLKAGIVGTANVAGFMEWYANFGLFGLLLSGLELGSWLGLIGVFLKRLGPMLLTMNILFILLLSSSSFHTLLFSGGWGLTVILSYLMRNTLIGAAEPLSLSNQSEQ